MLKHESSYLYIAILYVDDLTNYSDCLASIGSINQYWVTCDEFLREVGNVYNILKQ